MKILTYNVDNGAKEREDILFNYLKVKNADIIGLNELNDWTQNKLEKYSLKFGFNYCYITKNQKSKYKIGIVSKLPIENPIEYVDQFIHATLLAKINNINIIVTHLTPHDSLKRENESKELISIVSKLDGKILIMGDFNSLSPIDKNYYDNSYLNKFLNDKKLNQKFLDNEKEINYKPIEIILKNGFIDLNKKDFLDFTVPTKRNVDSMHALPMRLDYIFAKDINLKSEAYADKNKITDELSDHYPVIAEIKI